MTRLVHRPSTEMQQTSVLYPIVRELQDIQLFQGWMLYTDAPPYAAACARVHPAAGLLQSRVHQIGMKGSIKTSRMIVEIVSIASPLWAGQYWWIFPAGQSGDLGERTTIIAWQAAALIYQDQVTTIL